MSVSPVSASSAVHTAQPAHNPAPASKPAQQPDTVHLSPAAMAKLKGGGDADRDGDSK
jgi:hypothetical protein